MSTIVTRAGKGSPLTNTEVDSNFTNLNTDKVETLSSADGSIVITGTGASIDLSVSQNSPASVLLEQVRNSTGATLTKGTAVYISGATGQLPTVSKALATGDSTSAQTLGLINSDLANNANGYVTIIGLISNINTSAYTDGAQLYLSPTTAGTLTATKPYAPQHLVYVAVVAHAHPTQGKLLVKVQNGYEMDELHNVSAQSPTNGDTLVYNSTTTLWTKTAQSTLSVASAAAVPFSGVTSTPTTLSGYGITDAYSSSNPSGYITSSALSPYLTTATAASTYLPLAGGTLTGKLTLDGRNEVYGVPTNAGTIAGFMGGTSGGTTAARTQSLNTQTLLNIAALGYTGSAWVGGAGLSFVATENQAAGTRGTKAVLSAITTGDSTATTMEFNGSALTINGSTAVTSSNYNSYAPTLTGTGATGTWGISITGTANVANSATSAGYLTGGDSGFYGLLYNTLAGDLNTYNSPGLYSAEYTGTTNKPSVGANGHIIQISDAGGTDVKTQWFFPNGSSPYMRLMWGNTSWQSWLALLTSSNYNSYSPTLTGTNASGTWGISISGNAATATDATNAGNATTVTSITSGQVTTALGYTPNAVNFSRFTGNINTLGVSNATSGVYDIGAGYTNGPAADLYGTLQAYWNGDIAIQFWHSYNGDSYWRKSVGSTFSGAAWRTNLDSANYNSYAPTLTGTGASGTWGINITGNAATATTAVTLTSTQSSWGTGVINNVIGMLAWKNYGNSHVIFDASQGTSPSGGAVNNTNAGVAWSASYPTLMGWNGGSTYGVRVDSARVADSAGAVDYNALTNKGGGTGSYITSGDYRAPIFYDSNDTGHYGDFASTSRFNLAKVNGVYDSSITRGVIPSGAVYTTSAGAPTGAFKIKLPDGSRLLYPMLSFTVELYNYSTGTSRSFRIGGHFSGTAWHNVFAYCLTDYAGSVDVRFGYDAANAMCVWIGEVGSTWSYPQVFVTDFQNGYSAIQESWFSGWSITLVTAFDTVSNGPYTPAMGLNSKNYNSYSPTLTGTGASGTWGISITGNAATVSNIGATQVTNLYSPNAASVVAADSAMPAQGNSLIHTLALGPSGNDGHIIGMTWANTTTVYGAQIWLDTDPTNQMAIRGRSSAGAWTAWAPVLTSVNYNSYSPTLTGGSASGTWGINITGNSATATTLQTNGTVSFTTDNSGIHVIGTESTGSNVRLGAAWNRPGIYNGSGTTAGGLTGSITIGSENSIYFVTQNVERGRFDNSGIGYASASFRAPIFYDSDDTTYYANPNSFSQFSSLSCNGDFRAAFVSGAGGSTFGASHYSMGKDYANGGWSHPHYSDLIIGYHTGIRIGAHYSGIRFYNNSPTTDANNDGNGDVGEALLMTVGGYVGTANHTDVYVNNNLFAGSSMRAPVYYDSNDTSYYTNPNSFSQMSYGNFNAAPSGRTLSLGGDQTDRVYNDSARSSLVINATQYPHLYINATTNISNLNHGAVLSMTGNLTGGGYRRWGIGIANTDPDCFSWGYADNDPNPHYGVGGTFGYTGTPNIRMWLNTGGSLMTTGDMRAPLFYDSNNTAYYGDFASTSRINRIDYTNLYWATNTNYGFVGPDVYADTINSGAVGDQLELCYHRGSFTSSAGSMRAPLFYDRDDTGYYVDAASTSALTTLTLAGNLTMNGAGTSTSIIFGDATKRINVEGYWFMFKGHENEGFRWQTAGQDAVTYTTRMQLTSSALTVNGNTALHAGNYSSYAINRGGDTVSGIVYYLSNRNTTSDSCPLQAYSNNGSGATMSFHRGGYYAVNFGLDSDNVMRIGGWSASANRWQLDMSGNMTVAGNVTAYSDERLKKDWAPVASDFVASLAKIKSGTYTRIDSEERQAGVSAQDFQKLLPETISADNEGTLSLAYGNAALVSAVELAKDNVELRARIERLESLIHKLIGD